MKTEKFVEIKITRYNIDYYSKLGYISLSIGIIKLIKSKDVAHGVATKIYVTCESCGQERYIKSQNYHNQIKKLNFYVCQKCNNIKAKITNLNRYGVECVLQNPKIAEKSRISLMETYGVDNISKLDSIKEERRENFKNEDFKNKSKKTWLRKYGFDNPSKSDEIKVKKQSTCLENYGVINPSQSREVFEMAQKSGKKIKKHKNGLYFRGSYEKDFLDFCIENKIEVSKGPTIQYIVEGKNKFYHSDFYIEKLDLICEIKSSYYYKKYLESNLAKKEFSEKYHKFIFIIDKDYRELLEIL